MHTPGPWKQDRNIVRDECGWLVAQVGLYETLSVNRAEANARLIAAAPELLMTCRALLRVVEVYDARLAELGRAGNLESVPGMHGANAVDVAHAVIAKATGKGEA